MGAKQGNAEECNGARSEGSITDEGNVECRWKQAQIYNVRTFTPQETNKQHINIKLYCLYIMQQQ